MGEEILFSKRCKNIKILSCRIDRSKERLDRYIQGCIFLITCWGKKYINQEGGGGNNEFQI